MGSQLPSKCRLMTFWIFPMEARPGVTCCNTLRLGSTLSVSLTPDARLYVRAGLASSSCQHKLCTFTSTVKELPGLSL